MHRRALAGRDAKLGENHPDTLTSVWCLASFLAVLERYEDAKALYKRATAGYRAGLGEHHPRTVACSKQFTDMLTRMRRSGNQDSYY